MTTLLTMAVLLFMLNIWMYFRQPSMIFFPQKTLLTTPSDWGLKYEDVGLTSGENNIHAWYIENAHTDKVVLFFHGNGGNISHRGESVLIFHEMGLSVLIVDYRGYGKSGGIPTEHGLYLDAQAAWDYLVNEKGYEPERIIIFGRSLGGAVAVNLASRVRAFRVILESTFTSAVDVARAAFPVLSRLVILRYRFDSEKLIKHLKSPLLVLHSNEDEVIPYRLGKILYQAANQPKTFVDLNGNHSSGFLQSRPVYESALRKFILERSQ